MFEEGNPNEESPFHLQINLHLLKLSCMSTFRVVVGFASLLF